MKKALLIWLLPLLYVSGFCNGSLPQPSTDTAKAINIYFSVNDSRNFNPIEGARVIILTNQFKKITEGTTGKDGKLAIPVKKNEAYLAVIEKNMPGENEMYLTYSKNIVIGDKDASEEITLDRVKRQADYKASQVRFDQNSDKINGDENSQVIASLYNMLTEYPNMEIELAGYCDCSEDTGIAQKRAEAVVTTLTAKGIPQKRIVPKGIGNTNGVTCTCNNAKCTEEQLKLNRRVEFKVTRF
jgi:outer membrane protein OmpA-like peptidoglycan-associated protein